MLPGHDLSAGRVPVSGERRQGRTDIPIIHASAIRDVATASRAIEDGHVDLVAMTRAHIADPHIVRKLQENRPDDIRQCVGANYCVDRAGRAGCASRTRRRAGRSICLTSSSKRPRPGGSWWPAAAPAASRRRAPQPSAATRCRAVRGRGSQLGGQINLAKVGAAAREHGGHRALARAPGPAQGRRRCGSARRQRQTPILAEKPDIVFVATGGIPRRPDFAGADLTRAELGHPRAARWRPASNVLVYDEVGSAARGRLRRLSGEPRRSRRDGHGGPHGRRGGRQHASCRLSPQPLQEQRGA